MVVKTRVGFLLAAFIVCCIAAAHNMSKVGLPEYTHKANTMVKLGAQAALFGKEFWKMFLEVVKLVGRVSVGFLTEATLPWALALASSLLIMWTSKSLYTYLAQQGSNYLEVLLAVIVTILVVYSLVYVEFISMFALGKALAAPFGRGLRTFVRGAWADVTMLAFHLAWLVPVTALVLLIVSRTLTSRILFSGIGVYVAVFTVSFCVILVLG